MGKKMTNISDEVVLEIINNLHERQAKYQSLYYESYGEEDLIEKHTHKRMIDLCKLIREKINLREKGNNERK